MASNQKDLIWLEFFLGCFQRGQTFFVSASLGSCYRFLLTFCVFLWCLDFSFDFFLKISALIFIFEFLTFDRAFAVYQLRREMYFSLQNFVIIIKLGREGRASYYLLRFSKQFELFKKGFFESGIGQICLFSKLFNYYHFKHKGLLFPFGCDFLRV